jgi:hypothetical protein
LRAPPFGLPTNGIESNVDYPVPVGGASNSCGDQRLRGGLASIFFFILIQKRNKKNQGYE